MILSNEPGYYKTGEYGIRIENLILVEPREIAGGERPMLGFETLTLAPFDRTLVDVALLDAAEIAWLDAYHRAGARDAVRAELDVGDRSLARQGDAAARSGGSLDPAFRAAQPPPPPFGRSPSRRVRGRRGAAPASPPPGEGDHAQLGGGGSQFAALSLSSFAARLWFPRASA